MTPITTTDSTPADNPASAPDDTPGVAPITTPKMDPEMCRSRHWTGHASTSTRTCITAGAAEVREFIGGASADSGRSRGCMPRGTPAGAPVGFPRCDSGIRQMGVPRPGCGSRDTCRSIRGELAGSPGGVQRRSERPPSCIGSDPWTTIFIRRTSYERRDDVRIPETSDTSSRPDL